jgi:hypothetical protein
MPSAAKKRGGGLLMPVAALPTVTIAYSRPTQTFSWAATAGDPYVWGVDFCTAIGNNWNRVYSVPGSVYSQAVTINPNFWRVQGYDQSGILIVVAANNSQAE